MQKEGRKNNKDDLHTCTWPGLQFLGRFEVVSGGVRGGEEGGSGGCPGAHWVALAPPTAATHDRPRPRPRLGGRGLLRGGEGNRLKLSCLANKSLRP